MLKGPLIEMGMPSAFSSADFAGLSSEPFSLWDVAHESVISVDEDGTEAAGATLGSGGGSPGFEPIVRNVNRSFLHVIQDKPTVPSYSLDSTWGPPCPSVLLGMEVQRVRVEVESFRGVPKFELVGLAEASVRESYVRVRSALHQLGLFIGQHRMVVNLAPADVRRIGRANAIACEGKARQLT